MDPVYVSPATMPPEVRRLAGESLPEVRRRLEAGERLSDADREAISQKVRSILAAFAEPGHGNH